MLINEQIERKSPEVKITIGCPKKMQHVSHTVTLHLVHQNCSVMAHFKDDEIT